MYIIGEKRPIINKKYSYFLRSTDISHSQVMMDNTRVANLRWYEEKPKPEPEITWKIYLGKKLILTRTTGIFTFAAGNQKYTLVAVVSGKEVARTTLHTLGGKPAIEVFWQDDYGQKIGNKTVGYLDKVYLKIKTSHIPIGDTLQVTIHEDEKLDGHGDSSHNMSTHTTTPVNKNGYASVYFNNLQGFKVLMKKRDPNDRESEHEYYAKIAYASHLVKDADTIKDTIQLKVKNTSLKLIDPPVTNMTSMVGEVEKAVNETQKVKNLTIGVFIDGTMNNRYDTIARENWERKRLQEKGKIDNPQNRLEVYATKEENVTKSNYKYGQTSYENDLSNPAILFDNYKKDDKTVFKVYTEGMGTNTLGNEKLEVAKYEKDDSMGAAVAWGNSGIVKRVHRAVEQTVAKIKTDKEKIGTITIDVFGFSRGAASARHFVHEIFKPAYKARTVSGKKPIPYSTKDISFQIPIDDNGNPVDKKYCNLIMPTNGRLGYLLTQKGITIDKLEIRFAGLYDTVAHHGSYQGNDVDNLGLNTISSKAKHIVHMTAGDEHRYNFSLSRIPRKKDHIELNLPGVHCDVGGSYAEGRPEGRPQGVKVQDIEGKHILGTEDTISLFKTYELKKLRTAVINEGWFLDDQIKIHSNYRTGEDKLVTNRAYVSNQYSFIPLHLMLKLAMEKELVFTKDELMKSKNFTSNIFPDHLSLIKRIQSNIEDYATKVIANPTGEHHYIIAEADLKKLRNRYLHYNATNDHLEIVNQPEDGRIRDIIEPSK